MTRKIAAFALALLLLLVSFGCAAQPSAQTTAAATTAAATTAAATTAAATTAAATTAADTKGNLLPYTGDEVTFTFFWFDTGADYSDPNLPIVQEIQKKMGNISLELEILPLTDYQTKIPLYFASGEIPDMMIINNVYNYLATYGPNGILMDWAPLMEQYMPNVYQYAQKLKMYDTLKDADGHQLALPLNVTTEDYVMMTWAANQTLLDELGIPLPETADELLDDLRKVKEQKDMVPIQMRNNLGSIRGAVSMMFNHEGDQKLQYYPDEGKWDFGPTRADSQFRPLLEYMNTLWKEQLVDPECNAMTEDQILDHIYKGEWAFTFEYQARFSHTKDDNYTPFTDFEITCFATPRGTGAYESMTQPSDGYANWAIVSDVNNKHPDLLAACLDLMYSDEIGTLCAYGIEGETYTLGSDGLPYFTDVMKVASNGYAGSKSLNEYGRWRTPWNRTFGIANTRATRLIDESEKIFGEMEGIKALLDSGERQPWYNYGAPSLDENESNEFADIMTPVNTYLDECTAKFIMGDMDIGAEWDTFMANLQKYGDIQRAVEIYNSKEMLQFTGNWR